MNLRRTWCLVTLLLCAVAPAANGDDAKPGAIQTGIGYTQKVECESKTGLADLGASFFGSGQGLQEILKGLFDSCEAFKALETSPYKIVVFLAKPTVAAQQGTVAHFIYNRDTPITPGMTSVPGVEKAAWVYITEDDQDTIVSQLTTTAVDNPVFAQLGSLAGAVGGKIVDMDRFAFIAGGGDPKRGNEPAHTLRLLVTPVLDLKGRRATIAEADFISSPKRDAKGALVDKDGKPSETPVFEQIAGSFSLTNTPPTWVTVHAGVGFFVGDVKGDRMKVDNKAYASDPLPIGMTLAGATFHLPYDAGAPAVSWRERTGWFLSAVLTPAGGVATGFSIGVRGIGLNVGFALMRVDSAPAGKIAGNAVDEGANPQLVKINATSWFIGAAYALK